MEGWQKSLKDALFKLLRAVEQEVLSRGLGNEPKSVEVRTYLPDPDYFWNKSRGFPSDWYRERGAKMKKDIEAFQNYLDKLLPVPEPEKRLGDEID